MAKTGRPKNTGLYPGPSQSKSFRLSLPAACYIAEQGDRQFLEDLVPKEYRENYMKSFPHYFKEA